MPAVCNPLLPVSLVLAEELRRLSWSGIPKPVRAVTWKLLSVSCPLCAPALRPLPQRALSSREDRLSRPGRAPSPTRIPLHLADPASAGAATASPTLCSASGLLCQGWQKTRVSHNLGRLCPSPILLFLKSLWYFQTCVIKWVPA